MSTLLPGAISAERGSLSPARAGKLGGIGRMTHRAPRRDSKSRHLDEDLVRGLAHQRDQLSTISRYTGRTPWCASVLDEQYQSRSAPPGPQPSRPYSPMVISV